MKLLHEVRDCVAGDLRTVIYKTQTCNRGDGVAGQRGKGLSEPR